MRYNRNRAPVKAEEDREEEREGGGRCRDTHLMCIRGAEAGEIKLDPLCDTQRALSATPRQHQQQQQLSARTAHVCTQAIVALNFNGGGYFQSAAESDSETD